jgi:putative oxidoreductase
MNRHDDAGKLVLRLVLGVLILLHGINKMTHGVAGITTMVSEHGLPGFLGYFVYIGEVIAPILLIAGLFARLGGLLVVINMLVAFALVHHAQIGSLNGQGGWAVELQGMYLFTALAIALFGAGRYSIGGANGRFN